MKRQSTALLTRLLVVVVGFALTISVLACETAEPESTPTPTAEPTVTTPIADVLGEDEELMVDYETLWSEYFETLSEGEVSCIRSALEEDDYDEMLARQVVSGERVIDRHEIEIWACLTQENAIHLYLTGFYTFRPDDRTDDELAEIDACHRSVLQYVDFARYLEASATEIHAVHSWHVPRSLTLISHSMVRCWIDEADFFPYSTFPVYEARPLNFVPDDRSIWRDGLDEISKEERDCIRNVIGSYSYEILLDEAIFDGETAPSDVAIWECLGRKSAVSVLRRTDAFDALSRLEFYRPNDERHDKRLVRHYVPCMDRVLERMDFSRLIAAGLPDVGLEDYRHGVAAIMGFGLCYGPLPSVVGLDDHSYETGFDPLSLHASDNVDKPDYRDDHGDDEENATVLEFGETVSGVIGVDTGYNWFDVNSVGDPDVFSFEAERGRLYQIVVEPGSLLRSRFKLFDSTYDVWEFGDTHFLWEAERSGTYYVMVNGRGVGDYELTADRFDYSNDHGNDFSSATPIEVGETLSGTIGLAPEFDFFRFTATEGEAYEIYLKGEGLKRGQVSLFDTDGTELDSKTGFFILHVEGLASKDYYIVVGSRKGYGRRSLDDEFWARTSLDDPRYGGDYRLSIAVLE